MKGIYQQIREKSEQPIDDEPLTLQRLKEFWSSLEKSRIEDRKKRQKSYDENEKHLQERSKELGKDVPVELLVYVLGSVRQPPIVPGWLVEKYKEWF